MLRTPKINDLNEDSEVDNCLKKIQVSGLGTDVKSVAGFSSSCQFRVRRNDVP